MNFNKIFDAFPPPKFLDIPFAGLSISDNSIHCIQFENKWGRLHIKKYGEKVVPKGVITSGEVNDKEVLTTILQELKKDLDLTYVKVSLPEEKAYLFTTKIPLVKPSEIKEAIESKIEENVPVSPSELIFDYKLIEHDEAGHIDVAVSTLPITVVESYVGITNSAGLYPLSMEVESQAIARCLLPPDSDDTVLIVHFGPEKVGLYVASDRVVRFTSTVNIKGDVSNNPDFLSQEIKRLFAYWHLLKDNADKEERKISQIIISGENFSESIIPYLASNHQTKVILGNVWTNAFDIKTDIPAISHTDSLKYSAAIGLALPVNILI
ncbi:MAG: pilus assembly protein PilM [Parcubacteria group bacterium]